MGVPMWGEPPRNVMESHLDEVTGREDQLDVDGERSLDRLRDERTTIVPIASKFKARDETVETEPSGPVEAEMKRAFEEGSDAEAGSPS
jgi:hypothetical protein